MFKTGLAIHNTLKESKEMWHIRRDEWTSRFSVVISCILFLVIMCGCGSHDECSDPLQICSAEWESLSVQYCVGAGPQVVAKKWASRDEAVMRRLKKAMIIKECASLSLIGTMTTNRLQMRLDDGNAIEMYVLANTQLSMHDPKRPKRSYLLIVDTAFVEVLKNVIAADTGDDPRFYYSHEVDVRQDGVGGKQGR